MITRRALLLTLLTLAVTTLAAGPALAQETPRSGGVLKAAKIGEPPTLDLHWTTAVITQEITFHVYESLFTYDANFAPVPMLAESYTLTPDGRRYTIPLRKGVRFHTGRNGISSRYAVFRPPKPLGGSVRALYSLKRASLMWRSGLCSTKR